MRLIDVGGAYRAFAERERAAGRLPCEAAVRAIGICTPRAPMTVGLERLTPGPDRSPPSHDWVRTDPAGFTFCDDREAWTLRELARMLESEIGHRQGRRRLATRSDKWALPRRPAGASPWKL
jgi:hypothetical protein